MKVLEGWKLFVVALAVVVIAAASLTALVVPGVGGAVARGDGDGSTAAECLSGTTCGGRISASLTPTPVPPPAAGQNGPACGGCLAKP